jgi:hypothetical protein
MGSRCGNAEVRSWWDVGQLAMTADGVHLKKFLGLKIKTLITSALILVAKNFDKRGIRPAPFLIMNISGIISQ